MISTVTYCDDILTSLVPFAGSFMPHACWLTHPIFLIIVCRRPQDPLLLISSLRPAGWPIETKRLGCDQASLNRRGYLPGNIWKHCHDLMLQSARPARIVALSVEQSALASMPCPVIILPKTEKRFLDGRKTDRKPYRRKQAWTLHDDDDVAKVSKLKLSLSETGAAVAPEPSLLPPASAVPPAGVLCMSVPAGPKARIRLRLDSAWPSARQLALLLLPSAWRLPLTLCMHYILYFRERLYVSATELDQVGRCARSTCCLRFFLSSASSC